MKGCIHSSLTEDPMYRFLSESLNGGCDRKEYIVTQSTKDPLAIISSQVLGCNKLIQGN